MADDAGRVLYAGLSLLDRQLLDRNKRPCGKVDDLELEVSEETGEVFVSALLSGPGMLLYRMGRRRMGRWLQRVSALMWPADAALAGGVGSDPNRIPMSLVSDIGNHVEIAADHDQLGTAALGRWAREHVTSHVPASGHQAKS